MKLHGLQCLLSRKAVAKKIAQCQRAAAPPRTRPATWTFEKWVKHEKVVALHKSGADSSDVRKLCNDFGLDERKDPKPLESPVLASKTWNSCHTCLSDNASSMMTRKSLHSSSTNEEGAKSQCHSFRAYLVSEGYLLLPKCW